MLGFDFSGGMPEKLEKTFYRYERGELNTESFLWALQQFKPEAKIRDIIAAWNSILGELPQSRFDMVGELRNKYNIAMLSNINAMHEEWIDKHVQKEMGIPDFHTTYFDKVFYSHHIGHRKPEPACYAYVQRELGIEDPSSILFIDDLEVNIMAARAAGWQGVVHDPEEDVICCMEGYLVLFLLDDS